MYKMSILTMAIYAMAGFVLAAILFSDVALAQQDPCDYTCFACQKTIDDTLYTEISGHRFHDACLRCTECGTSLKDGRPILKEDRLYCLPCFKRLFGLRCMVCGEPITGSYTVKDGKIIDEKCADTEPPLFCTLCGEPISGRYIYNYWGDYYHAYHKDNAPKCQSCNRFISDQTTSGGVTYEDGRIICSTCRQSAIDDFAHANMLTDSVRFLLAQQGIDIRADTMEIRLLAMDSLKIRCMNESDDVSGCSNWTYTNPENGKPVITKAEIVILYGLPQAAFVKDLAHELMHIWMASQSMRDWGEAFLEGSCNYASLLVLEHYHKKDPDLAVYYIENLCRSMDTYYGQGFRRVKALVDQQGIPAWLESLQTRHDFPEGF